MIHKTEGIVLKTLKFGESSLITTIFTRNYGLKSFILKAGRTAKSRKKHSYFQPLSCIDLVFYEKESRDLQKITESSVAHFFHRIQTDPGRIALGIPIIDIFARCVKEQEENIPLYEFLKTILIHIDQQPDRLVHVFLFYLIHLSLHLGFFPHLEIKDENAQLYFNLAAGTISHMPSEKEAPHILIRFMHSHLDNCREIQFSGKEKRELIKLMFEYYELHVAGFKEPDSIRVFEDIFKG